MVEPNPAQPERDDDGAGEPLQFDQAEYATPVVVGPTCTVCQQPIADVYYELVGKVVCARCRQGVEAAFRGGSRTARVLKALILGTVAAVVGPVIDYAIIRATNINSALVAILVGFMVGGAVRKGSGNRGGPFYQALAIFLTYSSIAALHIPFVFEAAMQVEQEEQEAKKDIGRPEKDGVQAKVPDPAQPAQPNVAPLKEVAGNRQPDRPRPQPSLGRFLLAMAAIFAFLYSIPVQMGFHSPISGLIYAFALWEAWKMNRGVILTFNGPFRLGTGGSGAPAFEVIDDGG